MEQSAKKKLALSSLICLLPAAVGTVFWNALPDRFVRQFLSDGSYAYASKAVVVFAMPVIFLAVHLIYCLKPGWLNLRTVKNKYWLLPFISNAVFALMWIMSAAVAST